MSKHALSRRKFMKQAMVGGAALLGGAAWDCVAPDSFIGPRRKPNLVFMLSDQHAYDMLGCYGNSQILTPNLDRLAGQGVRFAECIANVPVCTPSRGSLLSGLHPLKHGAFHNDVQMLPGTGNYFGDVLKKNGYRTGYIGKWHLMGGDRNRPIPPGPLRYGFDDTFLSNNCTLKYAAGSAYYWNEHGQRTIYDAWEPYAQARQAIEFLKDRDTDQPFALFIAWHPPHDMGKRNGEYCYDTETDLMGLYDAAKIRLRANVEDSPAARRQYRGYMAMCSGIDRAAGMVLDALQQQNLETNTLVVYTADHGDLLGSHHRPKPKGYPEQESLHVPLLMRLPGQLEAATNSNLLIGLLDMMPTVLGLLQLEVPANCQGRDLSGPILAKDDNAVASLPLYFFAPAWRGVYTRQYTYAFDEQPGADASVACRVLYDRLADPVEIRNQFASREYAAMRNHLHTLSREWLAGFNDPCPTSSELFRLCALDREHLTQPGAEAQLKQCPVDLLRQNSFKSFLE